jgi:hypothetical protein
MAIYDFDGASWSAGPSLPAPVSYPAAAIVDEVLYVAGGQLESGSNTMLVSHDLEDGGWIVVGTTPFEISRAQGAGCHGRLWVLGDYQLWSYDPAADTWSGPVETPEGPSWFAMAVVDDELYLVGTADVRVTAAETTFHRYVGPGAS